MTPSRSTDLSTVARLIAIAAGSPAQASYLAEAARAPESVRSVLKSAVAAGSLSDANFASALAESGIVSSFVESLRSRSVLARILADGAARVPLRTRVAAVTANATGYVKGEGLPLPLSVMALAGPALVERLAAAMIVLSSELLRSTSPAGRALLDASLKGAVADAVDAAFLDVVADGLTPTPASGPTAANAIADLRAMLEIVNVVGNGSLFWVASPDVANGASTLTATSGDLVFPGASAVGGELLGLPMLVTSGLISGTLMLIDASGLAAEVETITVAVADQASLQFETAPTNPPGVSTVLESLWQTNRIALLARAFFGAERLRDSAVSILSDVEWGS